MEIEMKARVKNLSALKKELIKKGIRFGSAQYQEDVYYKFRGQKKDTRAPGDLVLRTRFVQARSFLTLKKNTTTEGSYEEYEVEFSGKEMPAIIKGLGMVPVIVIKKNRWEGKIGMFMVCLDHIEGLGNFIEIEVMGRNVSEGHKQILEFLESFGIKKKDVQLQGYGTLLLRKKGLL